MTESIQGVIDQISEKAKAIHELLILERESNAMLVAEIQELKTEIEEKSGFISVMETKLNDQEIRLEGLKEQNTVSNVAAPSSGRNQEIDELVKEIEYCIGQLRK